jgi:hypothetical protein
MRNTDHACTSAGAADKTKFMCTNYWMRCFLFKRLKWSWRVGTKAAQKLPDNWEQLIDQALQRIAAMASLCNIPPERVFMADETFLFYQPESKCAFVVARELAKAVAVHCMLFLHLLKLRASVSCELVLASNLH